MNSTEVVYVEMFNQENLEKVMNNFKHGFYISFVKNLLNKQVSLIEDYEIKKRFFREEEKESIEGNDNKILFKLEDSSIIVVEPLSSESNIRLEFIVYDITQEEADRKLFELKETVLNFINF
jgi:hypothetical protein